MIEYKEYEKKLHSEYIKKKQWRNLKGKKNVCLLIGAGVTSCIVGNWNDLLNEIAINRCCSDYQLSHEDIRAVSMKDITPSTIKEYIKMSCGGRYLPNETDTVEKGEYLRFDPKDDIYFDSEAEREDWREVTFSYRVLLAMERLIEHKSRDGAGFYPIPYTEDFIQWYKDQPDPIFRIGRRTVSNNERVIRELRNLDNDELLERIFKKYSVTIDIKNIERAIRTADNPINQIKQSLGALADSSLDGPIRETLKTAKEHKKTMQNMIGDILRITVAHSIWRPSYATLEALLQLCLQGKVKDVLTYNFDMIFDRLLANSSVQMLLCNSDDWNVCVYGLKSLEPVSIKGFNEKVTNNTIRIYHVHGILDNEIKPLEPVVFSGAAYKSYEQSQFNCGNMYLASAFYNNDLLCVGFSGSDVNFRRFTDQMMHLKERKHEIYITRNIEEATKTYQFSKKTPNDELAIAYTCANTYLNMVDHYFKQVVHATILWAKNFETMAKDIKAIINKHKRVVRP